MDGAPDQNTFAFNDENGNRDWIDKEKMKFARLLMEKLHQRNCFISPSMVPCDLSRMHESFSERVEGADDNNHVNGGSDGCLQATIATNAVGRDDDKIKQLQFPRTMGGYNSITKELNICSNLPREVMESTIVHELIHAYDDCKGTLKSPENIACSEIRAAHLSGDCDVLQEIYRGYIPNPFKLQDHLKACIRRRAILSLNMNPGCSNDSAENEMLVTKVFDKCFQDRQPFAK